MNNLNIIKTGNVAGIISVVFFLVCMTWSVLFTAPELKELHLNLMRITYPGFSMNFIGAILGIVEAFIYGWLFGALLAWLCKKVCISN